MSFFPTLKNRLENVMSRTCIICHRSRAHEKFGGRGFRRVTCKDCRKLPKEERNQRMWTDEILGFLEQSNISKKNIQRLRALEASGIAHVVELAEFVREIAEVKIAQEATLAIR